jgi:hypothetical protein
MYKEVLTTGNITVFLWFRRYIPANFGDPATHIFALKNEATGSSANYSTNTVVRLKCMGLYLHYHRGFHDMALEELPHLLCIFNY